ncbi:MAG: thiopurine S-methyltransferase [Planctomycetota bacterium]|nr:thiopurine S-methyltransferase [Planctomycetota bacterium]
MAEAEHDFWLARWREGRIGFHEGRASERLRTHWPSLALAPGAAVLVPLCGKAVDLIWLAERGHTVLGVELSAIAVADFFREQQLEAQKESLGAFTLWRAGRVAILCGDFFALDRALAEEVAGGPLEGWWDRAAMIALPAPLRLRYVTQIAALTAPGARGLLVGFEYPPEEKQGPPFSVDEAEIRARYCAPAFLEPEFLQRDDWLDREPAFREQGLTRVHETLFRLARAP